MDEKNEKKPALAELALACGTDKASHGYCPFYERHLAPLREEPVRLLEIGVHLGDSLRMWRRYFANALDIAGLDIKPEKARGDLSGCRVVQLDAACATKWGEFLRTREKESWDVIIDDGGHTMRQQQTSFKCAWAALRPGGIFIIEDLHSSFNGQCNPDNEPTTWKMVEALRTGAPFSSKYIDVARMEEIRSEVESVVTWIRLPPGDKNSMTPRDSLTCVIRKKR